MSNLRLALQVDGNAEGAKAALKDTTRGLNETTAAVGRHEVAAGQDARQADIEAKRIRDVGDALVFERAQLARSSEQQAVHNELRRAGVTLASQEGKAIAAAVTDIQRFHAAKERASRVTVTNDALAFERAQLSRSSEQQAVHNALRRAGVTLASQEGQAISANVIEIERMRAARDKANKSSLLNNESIEKFTRVASVAGGQVGGLVGQVGGLFVGASRLGIAVTVATVALAATAAAAGAATVAYAKLESQQARYANQLAATGFASGKTVDGLRRSSNALGGVGTQSLDDIREAQSELVRYRAVTEDTFDRALVSAQKLANLGYVPLKEATAAYGQAIKDPIEGLQALEAAGLQFSAAEKETIRRLTESGQAAKAVNEIFRVSESQLGGANARSADTLSSAYGRLKNSGQQLLEGFGKEISEALRLKAALNGAAEATDAATKANERRKQSGGGAMATAAGIDTSIPGWENVPVNPAARTAEQRRIYNIEPDLDLTGEGRAPRSREEGLRDYYRRGGTVTTSRGRVTPQSVNESDTQAFNGFQDRIRISAEAASRIDDVTNALTRETEAAKLNETGQAQLDARRRAQVDAVNSENAVIREKAKRVDDLTAALARERFMTQTRAQFIGATASLKIEADTLGMTAGKAAAYRYEQEKLADARARGIPLTEKETSELSRQAEAIGSLTQRTASLRLERELTFERSQIARSPTEARVAQELRGAGIDANSDEGRRLGDVIRTNEALKTTKELFTDITTGGLRDLRAGLAEGRNFFDALGNAGLNALGKISDKLLDMAAQNLVAKAFGSGGGGGIGGIFSSLFGGKGSGGAGPVNVVGAAGDMPVPTFMAEGGRMGGGNWAVVGERGWELMQTHHGGGVSVYSHEKSKRMLGGSAPALPGFAGGGYFGPPPAAPSRLEGAGAPVVHVHPAAPGETFDVRQNSDGSLSLIGRMIDDKLEGFSRHVLPSRLEQIGQDPRRLG